MCCSSCCFVHSDTSNRNQRIINSGTPLAPYNNPVTDENSQVPRPARVPYHEYESIDEVVKADDGEIAVATDETPMVAISSQDETEEVVVVSRNPAYAAVEGQEDSTGYENVITPWRHYNHQC